MQEGWEERKDGEDVQLGDCHHLCGVEVVPVPQLVRCVIINHPKEMQETTGKHTKDGLDFFGLALLDECVKDDNVLALINQH